MVSLDIYYVNIKGTAKPDEEIEEHPEAPISPGLFVGFIFAYNSYYRHLSLPSTYARPYLKITLMKG